MEKEFEELYEGICALNESNQKGLIHYMFGYLISHFKTEEAISGEELQRIVNKYIQARK